MSTSEVFKQVRRIEIKTRGLVNHVFSGEYHSVFKGRGMEFSEVREYQFGDDIRNIDWNVTARFGHPFIKVFNEERELTIMLLVDISSSQFFGTQSKTKQRIAAEISAILAFSAMKNNDKVGLILFSDKVEKVIPPKKGSSHILRIIREVLTFTPSNKGTSISSALEYFNRIIKKRSISFLISDFLDEGYEKPLRAASRKHDLVGISITDPAEVQLPDAGLINFVDPETGVARFINTSSKNIQFAIKELNKKRLIARQQLFVRCKMDIINIDTGKDYIKPMINFFRARGKRW